MEQNGTTQNEFKYMQQKNETKTEIQSALL